MYVCIHGPPKNYMATTAPSYLAHSTPPSPSAPSNTVHRRYAPMRETTLLRRISRTTLPLISFTCTTYSDKLYIRQRWRLNRWVYVVESKEGMQSARWSSLLAWWSSLLVWWVHSPLSMVRRFQPRRVAGSSSWSRGLPSTLVRSMYSTTNQCPSGSWVRFGIQAPIVGVSCCFRSWAFAESVQLLKWALGGTTHDYHPLPLLQWQLPLFSLIDIIGTLYL